MNDPVWLCLMDPDYDDEKQVKGILKLKICLDQIYDLQVGNGTKADEAKSVKLNVTVFYGPELLKFTICYDKASQAVDNRNFIIQNMKARAKKQYDKLSTYIQSHLKI